MAAVREKLLTASDLAALCEVDLKTIHNWVDRGRIPHFRTPGRHLRFRAADVAEFLRAWGYSVPRELARASARTILVVGTNETLALVHRALGEGGRQPVLRPRRPGSRCASPLTRTTRSSTPAPTPAMSTSSTSSSSPPRSSPGRCSRRCTARRRRPSSSRSRTTRRRCPPSSRASPAATPRGSRR